MRPIDKKVQEIKDVYRIPDDKWVKFYTDVGDLLALLLAESKPHLVKIDREINEGIKMMGGNGQVSLEVNCNNYKVISMNVGYSKRVKFDLTS